MSVPPGAFIPCTVAAITHSQRMHKIDEGSDSNTITASLLGRNEIMKDYQPILSQKEILEELKKVLEQEKCKDEDSIPIYDLVRLTRKKYNECSLLNRNLIGNISYLTGNDSLFLDIDFDSESMHLIISYHGNSIYFTKNDGDLIITKSNCYCASDILGKCGEVISNRYDKFIEDISFYRDYIDNIKSTNSNLIINSDKYNISVSDSHKYISSFTLSAKIYKEEYSYDCNSNNITTICRGSENELFKRVFVKISDCPEWTHESLYRIRKEQLEEQERIEYRQMKKQKRLELIKKLNPFQKR